MYGASRVLQATADALAQAIEDSDVPSVCFCGVVPGDQAAMDYGSGQCQDGQVGMAWVRQIMLYPASGINVVNEQVNNCASGLGMDVEVGIARGVPMIDDAGNLPTPEDYAAASILQNDDALVMVRALRCILTEVEDHTMGTYEPFGPLGGIVGGTWSFAVLLD